MDFEPKTMFLTSIFQKKCNLLNENQWNSGFSYSFHRLWGVGTNETGWKYKKINLRNLKTNISNKKIKQSVSGNTNTVYVNPLNSLRFVLNKIKKDKINLNKNFYVFTGSTVGVVPIMGKGLYTGKIDKLGSAKAIIY